MYNPLLLFGKLSISISVVDNVSDASFPLVARAKYIDTTLRMLWFVSIVEFVETEATLTYTTWNYTLVTLFLKAVANNLQCIPLFYLVVITYACHNSDVGLADLR